MGTLFVKLSESDKRIIFAFLLILILAIALVVLLGFTITHIMKVQGKKLDDKVSDVVRTRVIIDKNKFVKYANRKNWNTFYKKAIVPMIIMIISGLVLLIWALITNFKINPFSKENGFLSLFYLGHLSIKNSEGALVIKWVTDNSPHFVIESWGSYIFFFGMLIGLLWFLWEVQSLMARTLRIRKLKESIFSKNLDDFNINNINTQNNQNIQNPPQNPNV